MVDELQVPADYGGNLELPGIWKDYWKGQRRYMEKKQAWFRIIGTHDLNHAMNFIRDGDGNNPNAALTVFRHFDSGSVAYGLVGNEPETTGVIDWVPESIWIFCYVGLCTDALLSSVGVKRGLNRLLIAVNSLISCDFSLPENKISARAKVSLYSTLIYYILCCFCDAQVCMKSSVDIDNENLGCH